MSKHIKNITIKNFKRFKEFSLNEIGQFNLILGNNNVGKTTFLEALLFDDNFTQFLHNLKSRITSRYQTRHNIYDIYYVQPYLLKTDINNSICFYVEFYDNSKREIELQLLEKSELTEKEIKNIKFRRIIRGEKSPDNFVKYTLNGKPEINILNYEEHLEEFTTYLPFISSTISYSGDLVVFYANYYQINKDSKNELLENLKILIEDIEDIEISPIKTSDLAFEGPLNTLILRQKDNNLPLPFAMLGDGALRLLRIILEVPVCKGKRLMIDEIDSGIHYSHMKEYLKIIFKIANMNNVQLFFTTHNQECIKYLKDALLDDDMEMFRDKTKTFTLKELPDKIIKAYKYDFEEFEYAVEKDIEIRGGDK